MRPRGLRVIFGLCTVSVAALLGSCAAGASREESVGARVETGQRIYTESCAACHGTDAKGTGPVAPLFKLDVPDLTRISARRGGQFPELEIYRIIDGQAQLPGHGDRHMPIWGYEFFGDDADDEVAHGRATAKIDRLIAYLRTIQRSD